MFDTPPPAAEVRHVQALPPYAQSLREIEAILKEPQLAEALYPEAILEIRKVSEGYIITTQRRTLYVDVHYIHSGRIGPAQFELIFH